MNTAAQLTQYLADWPVAGFDWHTRHCGTFAAGWVRLVTGRDALAGLEGHRTLADWRRAVGDDMAELVTRQLGIMPRLPMLAQVGDVVLLPGRLAGGTLALCAGRTAATVDEHGACLHLPMLQARCAWPLLPVHEAAADRSAA